MITMGAEIGRPSRLEVQTADEICVGGRIVLAPKATF